MSIRKDGLTCTATNREGNQCGRPPMLGGKVCASHGGKAPQVKEASTNRLMEALLGPSFVEIASGVDAGEEVVTNGNFQLKSKLYEAILEAGHVH